MCSCYCFLFFEIWQPLWMYLCVCLWMQSCLMISSSFPSSLKSMQAHPGDMPRTSLFSWEFRCMERPFGSQEIVIPGNPRISDFSRKRPVLAASAFNTFSGFDLWGELTGSCDSISPGGFMSWLQLGPEALHDIMKINALLPTVQKSDAPYRGPTKLGERQHWLVMCCCAGDSIGRRGSRSVCCCRCVGFVSDSGCAALRRANFPSPFETCLNGWVGWFIGTGQSFNYYIIKLFISPTQRASKRENQASLAIVFITLSIHWTFLNTTLTKIVTYIDFPVFSLAMIFISQFNTDEFLMHKKCGHASWNSFASRLSEATWKLR